MKHRSIFALFFVASLATVFALNVPVIKQDPGGMQIGTATDQPLAFYGAAPIAQRSGAAQTALTDSTGGDVTGTTLASTAGIMTVAIPIELASMTTSAADLITAYTPGFKFKVLAVDFATTTIGAGEAASQVLNLEIGTTNLTGGAVTVTLGGTDTLGELTAGTAVTAANTGAADATISVEVAASGTVFTGGNGVLLLKLQNMDTQDNAAKTAELVNELRASLVALGAIAGS